MFDKIKTVEEFIQALVDDCGLDFVEDNLYKLLCEGNDEGFTIGLMPVEYVTAMYDDFVYDNCAVCLKIGEYHVRLTMRYDDEVDADYAQFTKHSTFEIVKPVEYTVIKYEPVDK